MMTTPHPTASRAKIDSVLRCASGGEAPLFMPAIYEHKAWFIRSTPSAISRDGGLLARVILAEYEAIGPDALVVGVDVYNLEAEAVGCSVTYYEGNDTSIPGIKPGNHIVHVGDELSAAPVPDPRKDGPMPVNLETARAVRRELGSDLWLRGALSGPFSLAISLVGAEALFLASLDQRSGFMAASRTPDESSRRSPRVTSMSALNSLSSTRRPRLNCFRRRCTRSLSCRLPWTLSRGRWGKACATYRLLSGATRRQLPRC